MGQEKGSENYITLSHALCTYSYAILYAMLMNAERQHATAVQTYNICTDSAQRTEYVFCELVLFLHCFFNTDIFHCVLMSALFLSQTPEPSEIKNFERNQ